MFAKYLSAIIVVVLLTTAAFGQVKDSKKFSRLQMSENLRASLVERFNLWVEYERAGRYDKQFEMTDLTHYQDYWDVPRYIDFKQNSRSFHGELLELKVKSVEQDSVRSVSISIRAKLQKNNKKRWETPIMVARMENGVWIFYFTYVQV